MSGWRKQGTELDWHVGDQVAEPQAAGLESVRPCTVDFIDIADTLFGVFYAVSLTVRIGIFTGHASPLTGDGSASLKSRDAVFALSVAAKHFVRTNLHPDS